MSATLRLWGLVILIGAVVGEWTENWFILATMGVHAVVLLTFAVLTGADR